LALRLKSCSFKETAESVNNVLKLHRHPSAVMDGALEHGLGEILAELRRGMA
jgi:hypothetical protein